MNSNERAPSPRLSRSWRVLGIAAASAAVLFAAGPASPLYGQSPSRARRTSFRPSP